MQVEGATDATGRCVLGRDSQLYVAQSYVLEVRTNDEVESASQQFTVRAGAQTVELQVQRALGGAKAHFKMAHAQSGHWSSGLPLPASFDYRLVHRSSQVVVHETRVAATGSVHCEELPMPHKLFVGETYARPRPRAVAAHPCSGRCRVGWG